MGRPIVRIEAGQTAYPFEEMTSTDNTVFGSTAAPWSGAANAEPVVGPYGLLTGGRITPNGENNEVVVAAVTAMMPGATGNLDATTGVVTADLGNNPLTATVASTSPGAVDQTHKISSIIINAAGELAVEAGVEGLSFTETRGVAGGPPLIPVDAIEIGQIRREGRSAAPVTAAEIVQIPGLSQERSDYPVSEINFATGEVTFVEALPLIHVGPAAKKVYARFSTPMFAPVPYTSDWTPAESTYSVSSTDTYDGPVGSASASLGQASFTAQLKDGITENFLSSKGDTVWVEFRPDRDKSLPKQLTQGVLGVSRTFPAGGGFSASCTVTPRVESVDVAS
jgi:hypothetical protein